jgi:small subunit ribosomal protein S4
MGRIIRPKNKLARAIGEDLGLKVKSDKVAKRLNVPPGQHGPRGKRKASGYAIQLKEKQKLRFMYGLMERQLRRYVMEALKARGETGSMLLKELEQRLDNVVYRLGLAPTRAAARQLVSHGHVRVNNRTISAPSYRVAVNDIIAVSSRALVIPAGVNPPSWLKRKAAVGKIVRWPQREDISEAITEQLVVEFYSR